MACLAANTCEQVPYDNVRGEDFFQLDARFGRFFNFNERCKLEMFFQAFDLTNRANFGTSYGDQHPHASTFETPTNFIAASSAIVPSRSRASLARGLASKFLNSVNLEGR